MFTALLKALFLVLALSKSKAVTKTASRALTFYIISCS